MDGRARDIEIYPGDIHIYWRTLSYEHPPNAQEYVPQEEEAKCHLQELVDEAVRRGPEATKKAAKNVFRGLHPAEDNIHEPEVNESRKGRPAKKSTGRTKGWWEKILRGKKKDMKKKSGSTTSGSTKSTSTKSTGTQTDEYPSDDHAAEECDEPEENNKYNCPDTEIPGTSNTHSDYGHMELLPVFIRPLVIAIHDPVPDGHCGFRALSFALYGNQEGFPEVRRTLAEEMREHDWRYLSIFGEGINDAIRRIDITTTAPTTEHHWMMGTDLFVFATLFNLAVVMYSCYLYPKPQKYNSTILPVDNIYGETHPRGVIVLHFVQNHWINLSFPADKIPLPPPHAIWPGGHQESVDGWDNYFAPFSQMWFDLGGVANNFPSRKKRVPKK
ncbi:unnamed protein product [Linum trigynum]|uniref:OTU domain-containing protein n=1 Tax=Linum trigynum TaxID=586398 RepID=A0AAV2CWX3_9ROSI